MKTTILFPSDYFDSTKIDEQFAPEYAAAAKLPSFSIACYNHDAFIEGKKLIIHPGIESGLCIARTWMLKPEEYRRLYGELMVSGVRLINTPDEYSLMHLFPRIYPSIAGSTPCALFFDGPESVSAEAVNLAFKRFMVKDAVKSVKGYDFPACIDTPVTQDDIDALMRRFVELRGGLLTGGITLKEFVGLKRYDGVTNEYRVFYLNKQVVSMSRNSNQPDSAPCLPADVAASFAHLPSHYYTVDFGELADGGFTILETGDGQVSGLSPSQCAFSYYGDLRRVLEQGADKAAGN